MKNICVGQHRGNLLALLQTLATHTLTDGIWPLKIKKIQLIGLDWHVYQHPAKLWNACAWAGSWCFPPLSEWSVIGCSLAKKHIRSGAHVLINNQGQRAYSAASREPMAGLTESAQTKTSAWISVTVRTTGPFQAKRINLRAKDRKPADLQAEPCDKLREQNKHSRHHLKSA